MFNKYVLTGDSKKGLKLGSPDPFSCDIFDYSVALRKAENPLLRVHNLQQIASYSLLFCRLLLINNHVAHSEKVFANTAH